VQLDSQKFQLIFATAIGISKDGNVMFEMGIEKNGGLVARSRVSKIVAYPVPRKDVAKHKGDTRFGNWTSYYKGYLRMTKGDEWVEEKFENEKIDDNFCKGASAGMFEPQKLWLERRRIM
jgi:hypothetical protein